MSNGHAECLTDDEMGQGGHPVVAAEPLGERCDYCDDPAVTHVVSQISPLRTVQTPVCHFHRYLPGERCQYCYQPATVIAFENDYRGRPHDISVCVDHIPPLVERVVIVDGDDESMPVGVVEIHVDGELREIHLDGPSCLTL